MPKRTIEHKIETQSTTILREQILNEAVFRELSEKDYGIDGMIEFFNADDGYMTAEEILVQIKGSFNIVVKEGFIKTPSIKTDTMKYWVKKKQSVFILCIDVSKSIIYFADVKQLARSSIKKINTQKTISFFIPENNIINSNNLELFRREIFIADQFDQSKSALSEVILNFKDIYKKLIVNSGRNCFMIIDHNDFRIDLLNEISKKIKECWYFFGRDVLIHNFEYFMMKSYKEWGYEYVEMHITETTNYLKEQIHLLLTMVINTKDTYALFWEETDKAVVNRLTNEDDFSLMKEVAKGNVEFKNLNLLNTYY